MATETAQERSGLLTARGNALTLLGPELHVGDAAPETTLSASDLSMKSLDDLTEGGTRAALLICVPSLDTSTCSVESKTFNSRLSELPAGVKAYVVSMDLPFAQGRWCGSQGDISLEMLSDYRDHRFGYDYGLRIKENALIARANVIIGKDKRIAYIDVVPELTSEPDYDAVIAAATKAAG